MLRLRRYRVFLVVSILTILTIYHLSHTRDWDAAANIGVDRLRHLATNAKDQQSSLGGAKPVQDTKPKAESGTPPAQKEEQPAPKALKTSKAIIDDLPVVATISSSTSSSTTLLDVSDAKPTKFSGPSSPSKMVETIDPDTEPAIPPKKLSDRFGQHGQGRLDLEPLPEDQPLPRWRKQKEHFPIPTESLIPLPTGRPKQIPRIQKVFKDETVSQKADRERKQASVKEAFIHAWSGYKENAIPHDELKPLTGAYKDPFNGWGATLVDALDTLWIMDLKAEFEDAVEYVKKIDFTTSRRKDIPVFETVIRYLGGLLAAYDVSNQQYKALLDKAVELAEVLMGAFDTPNRMPMTYYNWAPSYASQPHRSGTRVVMAELGSLTMEFTRLAQLTREHKYYDAVARITNALEIYQNETRLPGLWPIHLDSSGCKKPERQFDPAVLDTQIPIPNIREPPFDSVLNTQRERTTVPLNIINEEPIVDSVIEKEREAVLKQALGEDSTESVESTAPSTVDRTIHKRDGLSEDSILVPKSGSAARVKDSTIETDMLQVPKTDTSKINRGQAGSTSVQPSEVDCEPQGLADPPHSKLDTFSLGAMADSTYEYLPKVYMLLGGQVEQYRKMYEYAAKTAKESLIYRAMNKENRNILFSGKLSVSDQSQPGARKQDMEHEVTHLTCFAGGMFAVGAQIFGIEGDLDIARGLTDGCVWAYEVTASGVMPESGLVTPCDSMDRCEWNETKWWDLLDPNAEQRMQQTREFNEHQKAMAEKVMANEAQARLAAAKTSAIGEDSEEILTAENTGYKSSSRSAESSGRLAKRGTMRTFQDNEEPTIYKGKIRKEYGEESGTIPVQKDGVAGSIGGDEDGPVIYQGKIKKMTEDDDEPGMVTSSSTQAPSTGTGSKATIMKGKIGKIGADTDGKLSPEEYEKATTLTQPTTSSTQEEDVGADTGEATSVMRSLFTPFPIVTHEEYAKKRIEEQRLPESYTTIFSKTYVLRPEAIESVFIMYRITGEEYWREKGWKMFNAVQQATRTEFGNSAVHDVTSEIPEPSDSMESFWLAETLKYFYLLFSDPSHMSLDEWVLNTEAHPFKRPR